MSASLHRRRRRHSAELVARQARTAFETSSQFLSTSRLPMRPVPLRCSPSDPLSKRTGNESRRQTSSTWKPRSSSCRKVNCLRLSQRDSTSSAKQASGNRFSPASAM